MMRLGHANKRTWCAVVTAAALVMVVAGVMVRSNRANAANLNVYSNDLTYVVNSGYVVPGGFFGKYFDNAIAAGLSLYYLPPEYFFATLFGWQFFFFEGTFGFSSMQLKENPETKMVFYTADAGPVLYYPLFDWLYPSIGVSAGGYYSTLKLSSIEDSKTHADYLARASLGVIIPISSSFSLRVYGQYSYYHMFGEQYTAISYNLAAGYNLHGGYGSQIPRDASPVIVQDLKFDDIFAVRYELYNKKGIGSLTLKNTSDTVQTNIVVEAMMEEVTDSPAESETIVELKPGEQRTIAVPVALTRKVLAIVEDRTMSVRLKVIFSGENTKRYYVETGKALVHNKNALTWDRTHHLGSFIQPKESTVSTLTRNIMSQYAAKREKGISINLQIAMQVFDALQALGVTYAADPDNKYAESKSRNAVDYVQLPWETLKKRAGDCDDLTVLFASMLESVGIRTAIVTAPNHVFMMFDTGVPRECAYEVSVDPAEYVVRNDSVWVPVEITAVGKGFMVAWKEGVKGIGGAESGIDVVGTDQAWEKYPPADIGGGSGVPLPDNDILTRLYSRDIAVLKQELIDAPMKRLQDAVKGNPNDYKSWNSLGILYGRNGTLYKSIECFMASYKLKDDYLPAYINLGNVFMLLNDYTKAIFYYKKALQLNPQTVAARLNVARAYYEMRDYDSAYEEYRKVIERNPSYAQKYSYLDRKRTDASKERAAFGTGRADSNIWMAE